MVEEITEENALKILIDLHESYKENGHCCSYEKEDIEKALGFAVSNMLKVKSMRELISEWKTMDRHKGGNIRNE